MEQYAREAMELSQQTGDQQVLAKSLQNLGQVQQSRGNLPEAVRHYETSVKISRREGFKESLSQSMVSQGAQAYWQGHFERAMHLGREGLAIYRDIHDGFHELIILGNLGMPYGGSVITPKLFAYYMKG